MRDFVTLVTSISLFIYSLAIPIFFIEAWDRSDFEVSFGVISSYEKALLHLGIASLFMGIIHILILIEIRLHQATKPGS